MKSFVNIFLVLTLISCAFCVDIGVNWGTFSNPHQLPPYLVVQMLVDNGFTKLKLFDTDPNVLDALAVFGSDIEVMVGIPNDLLPTINNFDAASSWLATNVTNYVYSGGVNIRYIAVGNEPLLRAYNGAFQGYMNTTLQNIVKALNQTGYGDKIKVTIPFSSDVVYCPPSNPLPLGGDFRPEVKEITVDLINSLMNFRAPLLVNIYPFLSLYQDPNFPFEFAFFDGANQSIRDGNVVYTNAFDANLDTLIWALNKSGIAVTDVDIIIGEIGWPTDGDKNANIENARRFNQGLIKHLSSGSGTPLRPGPLQAYLFSLIDENAKSTDLGNFERHWGLFGYDGKPKYELHLPGQDEDKGLIPTDGVEYMDKKWCVLNPYGFDSPGFADNVSYACRQSDCTSLGYGCSCGQLNVDGKASYAFNMFYQMNNQQSWACNFSGLAALVDVDPSNGKCHYPIMINHGSSLRLHWRVLWYLGCLLLAIN